MPIHLCSASSFLFIFQPSCQSGCRHLNRVAELESELREMKEEERERENKSLQEEAVSLSKVHNQLSTVRAERLVQT